MLDSSKVGTAMEQTTKAGKLSEHMQLEINTVDGALEAINAIEKFVFETQRNRCKKSEYVDIGGSLCCAKWMIAKYCSDE